MLKNSDTLDIEKFSDKICNCLNLKEARLANINSGYFRLSRKIETLSDTVKYFRVKENC